MIAVIEAFQGAGRNFLVTNPPGQLQDETEIDITHEALIRRWPQLSDPTRDPVKNEPVGWVRRELEGRPTLAGARGTGTRFPQ